jgi:protein-tyrosine kinase
VSLIEQAIARLKVDAGPKGKPGVESKPPSAWSPGPQKADEPVSHGPPLNVDLDALRVGGYLPEKDKNRQFADYFRSIKRPLIEKALSGTTSAGDPRIILVASALPGDGKTFTCVNLALSIAKERDISVLLVDMDVAKQHVTEIFGLRSRPGVLDALVDDHVDVEPLIVQTNIRGFSILPAGRWVDGTAELLSSNRMRKILESLCARNSRRILLLDSPPLLVTNEGKTLVKSAGQVVLVVRAGQTPRPAVQAAIALFDPNQGGGVILNQVTGATPEAYYGYGNSSVDESRALV